MSMTAEKLMQPMRFRVDIRKGLIQEAQYTALMQGDRNANRVIVEITDNGSPIDITGLTVEGSFIRPPDDARIMLTGIVHGSEAIVQIEEACYAESGCYQLDVELTIRETRRTVLSITGNVLSKGSGALIDVTGVIPKVDDIIAQYAEMQRVTRETEDARDQAIAASRQANFTVLDRFATYAQLIAAHPTGEAGQAFAVGTVDDNVVYIWGIDTRSWVNIGPVQGAQGPRGQTGATGATGPAGKDGTNGANGKDGFSPTVTVEEIEGGHRVTITSVSGTQTFDIMNGQDLAEYDQPLNTTDDVKFRSITTTDPLDADTLGGKGAEDYALKDGGEEWSFTLEDGTVVKKKVLLGV